MEIRSLRLISAPLRMLPTADAAVVSAAGWCKWPERFHGDWHRTTHGVVRRSLMDRGWPDPEVVEGREEGPWGLEQSQGLVGSAQLEVFSV